MVQFQWSTWIQQTKIVFSPVSFQATDRFVRFSLSASFLGISIAIPYEMNVLCMDINCNSIGQAMKDSIPSSNKTNYPPNSFAMFFFPTFFAWYIKISEPDRNVFMKIINYSQLIKCLLLKFATKQQKIARKISHD